MANLWASSLIFWIIFNSWSVFFKTNFLNSQSLNKNNSSSFFAIETNCIWFNISKFCHSKLDSESFLNFSKISKTLPSCPFQPSIIIKSGISQVCKISFNLLVITSLIESKSFIFWSVRVFILYFLYLFGVVFQFSITLLEATVCVPERWLISLHSKIIFLFFCSYHKIFNKFIIFCFVKPFVDKLEIYFL